ncbi:hypothetical protein NUSPORA_00780 [Nucleospora cyclopteri]
MKYFKPLKKFMSKKMAISKLNVTEKQFDKLCVLCSIYPVIADKRNCIDKEDDFYFTIDDIKFIYHSEAFANVKINSKRDSKRDFYRRNGLLKRAETIKNVELRFIPLIKRKYSSFGDSLSHMGNSLRQLYFIDLFKISNVKEILEEFEEFIKSNCLLQKAFLAKKGIYYQFTIQNCFIVWMVPYPGDNLENLIEEKKEIIRELKIRNEDLFDIELSQESEEIVEEENSKIDCSIIKYAAPILQMHIKLLIHKLKTVDGLNKNLQIFKNYKFSIQIKSIFKEIKFLIECNGGEVIENDNSEYVIAESVENVDETKTYIQAQYVFDSLNEGKVLNMNIYKVGKILPPHKSPFPSIFDKIDKEILNTLSNRKKYMLLDKIEHLE